MSYAEYVAAEQRSETRHEFLDGEVFAMADDAHYVHAEPMGPLHAALAAALIQHLGNALRGKPCRVYSSGLRVRIQETGLTTYPDLTVVCGKLETAVDDPNAVINSVVLIEVLSESSEGYDRGAKAAHYRRIPSLREYVLVSQLEPAIEVFRRNERGNFELIEARKGERIELAALGVTLDVDAIYADPLAQAQP
jgi:Uma2 family endonuclease